MSNGNEGNGIYTGMDLGFSAIPRDVIMGEYDGELNDGDVIDLCEKITLKAGRNDQMLKICSVLGSANMRISKWISIFIAVVYCWLSNQDNRKKFDIKTLNCGALLAMSKVVALKCSNLIEFAREAALHSNVPVASNFADILKEDNILAQALPYLVSWFCDTSYQQAMDCVYFTSFGPAIDEYKDEFVTNTAAYDNLVTLVYTDIEI